MNRRTRPQRLHLEMAYQSRRPWTKIFTVKISDSTVKYTRIQVYRNWWQQLWLHFMASQTLKKASLVINSWSAASEHYLQKKACELWERSKTLFAVSVESQKTCKSRTSCWAEWHNVRNTESTSKVKDFKKLLNKEPNTRSTIPKRRLHCEWREYHGDKSLQI